MRKITIDPKYTKTYKTEANLESALDKMNLPASLAYVLCEVGGRYTAVFINAGKVESGMYLSHLAHKGFKVIG